MTPTLYDHLGLKAEWSHPAGDVKLQAEIDRLTAENAALRDEVHAQDLRYMTAYANYHTWKAEYEMLKAQVPELKAELTRLNDYLLAVKLGCHMEYWQWKEKEGEK